MYWNNNEKKKDLSTIKQTNMSINTFQLQRDSLLFTGL